VHTHIYAIAFLHTFSSPHTLPLLPSRCPMRLLSSSYSHPPAARHTFHPIAESFNFCVIRPPTVQPLALTTHCKTFLTCPPFTCRLVSSCITYQLHFWIIGLFCPLPTFSLAYPVNRASVSVSAGNWAGQVYSEEIGGRDWKAGVGDN